MPQVFGPEHIIYLLISIALMIGATYWIRRNVHTEKGMINTIKIIGLMLLVAILWNRTSIALLRDGFRSFLPGTFCGASSLALALSVLVAKKNSPIFHSVAYTGLLGSILTLVYPDFIGQDQSFFYPMTISGLVHHTVMFYLIIVMLMTGYLKPELKKWHLLPLGLSIYMVYGLFLITVVGYGDAMYIFHPILEGTILDWDVMGVLFLALHAIFLIVWEFTMKNRLITKKA
ncbi:MAG: YwaF family protein [Bacilli bacterium]|nr:YwaF family protein [Bacilli bacterium]MBN2696155.1 YwaF family protein [Bacilli bacterium]